MKFNQLSVIAIIFLLVGCSSLSTQSPTKLASAQTITSDNTSTTSLPATSTAVPIFTDISCKPSSNPFAENPMMSSDEYHAGYYPNITITKICTFEGNISRGQIYKHQIAPNLVFCLIPSGAVDTPNVGWNIVISDTLNGSCDPNSENYVNFAPIVTPPFYGNLFFDVYGWHFRNKENTGENNGELNVPQKERFFNFVFNRSDYKIVWHRARCNHWQLDEDCAYATQTSTQTDVFWTRAKFTITELELGNLVPNSYAWIESMKFMFDVYLPAE